MLTRQLTPVTPSGRNQSLVYGSNRPIVLKKSVMVSTVEKYAFEIEIFTLI